MKRWLCILLALQTVQGWTLEVVGPPNQGAVSKYRSFLDSHKLFVRDVEDDSKCRVENSYVELDCDAVRQIVDQDMVLLKESTAVKPIGEESYLRPSAKRSVGAAFATKISPTSGSYMTQEDRDRLLPIGGGTWIGTDVTLVDEDQMLDDGGAVPNPETNSSILVGSGKSVPNTTSVSLPMPTQAPGSTSKSSTKSVQNPVPTSMKLPSIVELGTMRNQLGARFVTMNDTVGLLRYRREKPPMRLKPNLDKIVVTRFNVSSTALPPVGRVVQGTIFATNVMFSIGGWSSSYRFYNVDRGNELVAIDMNNPFSSEWAARALVATVIAFDRSRGDDSTLFTNAIGKCEASVEDGTMKIIVTHYDLLFKVMHEVWTTLDQGFAGMSNPGVCMTPDGIRLQYGGDLIRSDESIVPITAGRYSNSKETLSCMPDKESEFVIGDDATPITDIVTGLGSLASYDVTSVATVDGLFGYNGSSNQGKITIGPDAEAALGIRGSTNIPSPDQDLAIMAVDLTADNTDKKLECQAAAIYFNAPACAYRRNGARDDCLMIYGKISTSGDMLKSGRNVLSGWKFWKSGVTSVSEVPTMPKAGWTSYILLGKNRLNVCV